MKSKPTQVGSLTGFGQSFSKENFLRFKAFATRMPRRKESIQCAKLPEVKDPQGQRHPLRVGEPHPQRRREPDAKKLNKISTSILSNVNIFSKKLVRHTVAPCFRGSCYSPVRFQGWETTQYRGVAKMWPPSCKARAIKNAS